MIFIERLIGSLAGIILCSPEGLRFDNELLNLVFLICLNDLLSAMDVVPDFLSDLLMQRVVLILELLWHLYHLLLLYASAVNGMRL